MSISDFRSVVFNSDVHARAHMTLAEAAVDTTLRGSERFFLDHIIAPTLSEVLDFCDTEKARSLYTPHQIESIRIWAKKDWLIDGESPDVLREQGKTVFSPADIVDMEFNMTKSGALSYQINRGRRDYRIPVTLDDGQASYRLLETRGFVTTFSHYNNSGRAVTMFDLGVWYQRNHITDKAGSVLTIAQIMRSFLVGNIDQDFSHGYHSVDIALQDSEFKLVYNKLAAEVPVNDIYMWMMLCAWRANHPRNLFGRIDDAIAMSKMYSGEDVIHFLRHGEKSIKTVRSYYKANIPFDLALPFFDADIRGIRAIRSYLNSGVPVEVIKGYLSVGITSLDDINKAVENGIDPSLMGSLVAA